MKKAYLICTVVVMTILTFSLMDGRWDAHQGQLEDCVCFTKEWVLPQRARPSECSGNCPEWYVRGVCSVQKKPFEWQHDFEYGDELSVSRWEAADRARGGVWAQECMVYYDEDGNPEKIFVREYNRAYDSAYSLWDSLFYIMLICFVLSFCFYVGRDPMDVYLLRYRNTNDPSPNQDAEAPPQFETEGSYQAFNPEAPAAPVNPATSASPLSTNPYTRGGPYQGPYVAPQFPGSYALSPPSPYGGYGIPYSDTAEGNKFSMFGEPPNTDPVTKN
eukprot:TRINITY_DN5753_c0_g1_i1.p1 TRINITY_DN5753_c0_g1~~TRINITY_DN5753_c0_g1_i1.p1  ORF type:complete len:286 (-),score=33.48 TRINITY_DN5753_c0_g1_i1:49-870(-)